jgi:hypothetical protein
MAMIEGFLHSIYSRIVEIMDDISIPNQMGD